MNERINFCTLFDSNYLSRGVALYRSLEETGCNFHLYVFAFDDKCLSVLKKMQLKHCTVVSLAEFEDDELLRIKPTRTRAEYCWTCSSSTILYCINKFNLSNCTYIDADMFFYSNPSVLIEEMGNYSILITEHRYTPKYDKSALSGKYCVQFVTFKNDEYGMKVLHWWRNACIDWCYNRHEDGKFGDQKYLDDWTIRFEKVYELQNLGGGLALWNIQQYTVYNKNDKLFCKEIKTGKEFEPVFYHFHYLKYFTDGTVEFGRREITGDVKQLFYIPYLHKLEEAKAVIEKTDNSFNTAPPSGIKSMLIKIWRKATNVYHIYRLKDLLN
jgi:hypothetical protein